MNFFVKFYNNLNIFSDDSSLRLKNNNNDFYENNTLIRPFSSIDLIDRNVYQKELLNLLSIYKILTEEIEKQLNNSKFSLSQLKYNFHNHFCKKLKDLSNEINEISANELKVKKKKIFQEISSFIKTFQKMVSKFYGFSENCLIIDKINYTLFTKDNIFNFILSIFLQDDEIYQEIFQIQAQIDYEQNMCFKKTLEFFKGKSPEEFKVSDLFCLNSKTIEFFESNLKIFKFSLL